MSDGSICAYFSQPFPNFDFLMHFGRPLATFWLPLGSVGAPLVSFVVPFAPWWDSPRSLCPLLVAFGLLSFPSGTLAAFWMEFVAFPKEFKRILPCLAVTGGIPSFFSNDFKRAERASQRSEPRAKLFVESATRGSHCIFLPRMA